MPIIEIDSTIANLREVFSKHESAIESFDRGLYAGAKICIEAIEARLAVAAPKPFTVGESVVVWLGGDKCQATIVQLGPVLCYVETTGGTGAVTLSELAEWNR